MGSGAGSGADSVSRWASTSFFVSRPSLPVPSMVAGSSACSSTKRRTAGLRVGSGLGAAGSGLDAGAGAAACADSSISATTAPMANVVSVDCRCLSAPLAGDGSSTFGLVGF